MNGRPQETATRYRPTASTSSSSHTELGTDPPADARNGSNVMPPYPERPRPWCALAAAATSRCPCSVRAQVSPSGDRYCSPRCPEREPATPTCPAQLVLYGGCGKAVALALLTPRHALDVGVDHGGMMGEDAPRTTPLVTERRQQPVAAAPRLVRGHLPRGLPARPRLPPARQRARTTLVRGGRVAHGCAEHARRAAPAQPWVRPAVLDDARQARGRCRARRRSATARFVAAQSIESEMKSERRSEVAVVRIYFDLCDRYACVCAHLCSMQQSLLRSPRPQRFKELLTKRHSTQAPVGPRGNERIDAVARRDGTATGEIELLAHVHLGRRFGG